MEKMLSSWTVPASPEDSSWYSFYAKMHRMVFPLWSLHLLQTQMALGLPQAREWRQSLEPKGLSLYLILLLKRTGAYLAYIHLISRNLNSLIF